MVTKRAICEEDVEKKRARMEDRLTKLPIELQLRILSFLEAKQVIQTLLLLSKTWISLWTQNPVLKFNQFANYPNLYAFERFVNKVFCLLRDRKVDRLTFSGHATSSNMILKTVFDFAISHDVKQLEVQIFSSNEKHTSWPDVSLESLKRLELQSRRSMKCPFLGPKSGSFKNLTDLYLTTPCITDEEPFSGFPVLQRLKLIYLDIRTEGKNLSVHALNLTNLTISCYQTFKCCVLTTPRLRFFRYQGEFPKLITPAGGLPLLDTMVIGDSSVSWWSEDKRKMQENRVLDDLHSIFCAVSNATSLTLLSTVVDIMCVFRDDLVKKTSPFQKLKSLKVDIDDLNYQINRSYPPPKWPTIYSELPSCVKAYLLNNSPDAKVTII